MTKILFVAIIILTIGTSNAIGISVTSNGLGFVTSISASHDSDVHGRCTIISNAMEYTLHAKIGNRFEESIRTTTPDARRHASVNMHKLVENHNTGIAYSTTQCYLSHNVAFLFSELNTHDVTHGKFVSTFVMPMGSTVVSADWHFGNVVAASFMTYDGRTVFASKIKKD